MEIKIGNYCQLVIGPIKTNEGATISDLALASAVKYMIKENATDADTSALVSKTLSSGITIDSPSTGYVKVNIVPNDTKSLTPGVKYHALQIEYSSSNIIEVNIIDNKETTDKVTLVQDVIR